MRRTFAFLQHRSLISASTLKTQQPFSARSRKMASGFNGPGLPDGTFSCQEYQFGYISEGLVMENVDIFYGHLEYFKAIWYIL
jgi:hypothetical protein